MNKKELKELDNSTKNFIKEMKEYGVKDKTIELIMKDIQEYQEEQVIKMLKEMQERMRIILEGEE